MDTLSDAQIDERLARVAPWRRDGATIVLELELDSFAAAIALVGQVADAAEAANHHPDILVHGWNKLRLTLWTHSAGGLDRRRLRARAPNRAAPCTMTSAACYRCRVKRLMNDDEELPRSSVAPPAAPARTAARA